MIKAARLCGFPFLFLASCTASNIAPAGVAQEAGDIERTASAAIDLIARDYVKLTLAMGEKEAGYVDAYYGPPEWAEAAKTDPRSLVDLGNDIILLMEQLQLKPKNDDPLVEGRKRFLTAQLEAAYIRHAMVSGGTFSFVEEARGLFGVTPKIRPLKEFDIILDEIEQLVPGEGVLATRVEAFQNRYIIPNERLKSVFDEAIAECKRRTMQYLALPEGENFKMEFVTGKSWSGYNYYQGGFQSLIQINTDLPIRINRAVDLGCHEGYPGHHVYNILLEQNLTKGRGWREFSIYPLYSPQSLIAEGSANYGIDLAFPGKERLEYERDVLYPLAGLDPDTADAFWALQIAKKALSGARMTIAQGYLDGEIAREEAIEYLMKYQLVSRERAKQSLKFNDDYRSYVINYGLGQNMVKDWIEAQGDGAIWRWKAMEILLSTPLLPEDL